MTKKTVFLLAALAALAAGGTFLALRHRPHGAAAAAGEIHQCSMHPEIVSSEPGNCPICGMTLTKVVKSGAGPAAPGAEAPGHAAFELSPERQQLIGVKVGRAERRELHVSLRTAGQVAYDPDLYNAIAEYREAVSARKKLKGRTAAGAKESLDSLVKSASLRLRLMGLSDDQIAELSESDADATNLLLPGQTAWVYADVYQSEAPDVKAGLDAVVSVPSARGRTYEGKIAAVDSVLNAETRTLRARIRIDSSDGRLRPESFVNVVIRIPLGLSLAVPEEAVLDTGDHQLVFVRRDGGRFEPRPVVLGRQAEGYYEVLEGFEEGEEVVTSANFLIDSESRFRAAVSAFAGETAAPAPHSGH